MRKLVTVICPVYNEETAVPLFYARLDAALKPLEDRYDFEILFSDNRSTDRTPERVLELRARDPRVQLLELSRNFGYEQSMTAALKQASGDAICFIDVEVLSECGHRGRYRHCVSGRDERVPTRRANHELVLVRRARLDRCIRVRRRRSRVTGRDHIPRPIPTAVESEAPQCLVGGHDQQLVSHGVQPRAKACAAAEFPGDEAIEQIGQTSHDEHDERPAEISVDREDDEGRREQHPGKGELISRREHAHLVELSSRSILEIASMASAPVTDRES